MHVAIVVFCWASSMCAMGWLFGKLAGNWGLLVVTPIAFFIGYQMPGILEKVGS